MPKVPSAVLAASPSYIDSLYRQYQEDPTSLDPGWRAVFALVGDVEQATGTRPLPLTAAAEAPAQLDPIALLSTTGTSGFADPKARGTLVIEHRHIDDEAMRGWLEVRSAMPCVAPPSEARRTMLHGLVVAETFESFVGVKYPTKKRFGCEGVEAMAPLITRILQQASQHGVTDVVIGAMHRGRLNLMANVLGMPVAELLALFIGRHPFPEAAGSAADVPYHLGFEGGLEFDGAVLNVRLLPNPSHLEAVNAVALGAARGRQDEMLDPARVLCLILHTDASVIAQGSVAETNQLAGLAGYSTAGTIHLVVNNQIGFTTEPRDARTSRYCTGAWKAIDSAILHVNAADPDACLIAADEAVAFRQTFGRDAVIDLVGYRRNGHNEIDEPRFTQPVQYAAIDRAESVSVVYARRLGEEGVVEPSWPGDIARATKDRLEQAFVQAKARREHGNPGNHSGPMRTNAGDDPTTGVSPDRLIAIADRIATAPAGLALDAKLQRLLRQRRDAMQSGVSWALAEALAFGSLVLDGIPIRLAGQDTVRGAFSQRHLALTDILTGVRHVSLDRLDPAQDCFSAIDSPLSEYAVLGFEYGFSRDYPEALVLWEAQFGDFANGAQIIIDQFIASGQEKWQQGSNLVVLLPHGLEGQGPEHSSARLERLLPLCANGNIEIAHPSTPANYFHLLRRQAMRTDRKPLFVLTPKSLLRLPAARSPLSEFEPGTGFKPVLAESTGQARRILLCSGKIAYDLAEEQAARPNGGAAIARLEMLYPLDLHGIARIMASHKQAEIVWVQEEPINAGAWSHLATRLEEIGIGAGMRHPRSHCIARAPASSPAGSFHGNHEADQLDLVVRAFAGL